MPDQLSLDRLNFEEPVVAERDLLACCASRRWADEILARRPYHDLGQLRTVAEQVLAALSWADVEQALAAHPRIGERAEGTSKEAGWSRDEQAGATPSDELVAGNREYEQRFGHVFLICATGLTEQAILGVLWERLGNDPATERDTTREELRKIVHLRLGKAFG
ncbi:2-oxo-4-hydroxy-4-carboxy-5-ureidoimidazoline decarboxylase [Actinophytocola sp.]|uniref:2-oxo-4-hydroxy-4-carboxy-5-ureidoimidazoline decarboxylase n=1 Tax=Actinophytocola sp. TaxID=1872138 RepID=UPI00389997D9